MSNNRRPSAGDGFAMLWPMLAAILAVALMLRLAFVLVLPQPENAIGDSVEFDLLARHVLDGHGLSYGEPWPPSARRTPLYPLLLAGTYVLFDSGSYQPLLLVQALVDTAVVVMVAWLAWCAWGDRRVALLAALGWALYLPGAQLAGRLLADSPFTFLMVAAVCLFVAAARQLARPRRALALALLAGLILGLATLARPTTLPFLVILPAVLALWAVGGRNRPAADGKSQSIAWGVVGGMVVLLVAGCLLVLSPWFARNYRAFDRVVLGSTLVDYNFFQTHYRLDQPDYTRIPGVPATNTAIRAALRAEGLEPTELDEVVVFGEARRLATEMVQRHPLRFLHLVGLRTLHLWFNLGFADALPSPATILFAVTNAALLLLALIAEVWAVWLWRRRDARLRLPPGAFVVHASLVLILLYFTASHALVIAAGRYSVPAVPFLVVLAAGAALPLAGRLPATESGHV